MVAQAGRDDFSTNLACVGNKRNPFEVVPISTVLRFAKDADDRLFPLLGDFSCYPNLDKDIVKHWANAGWSRFRSSAWRPSGPTAFQFDTPLSASVISSMDASPPSDSLNGRGGNRSMIVGSMARLG